MTDTPLPPALVRVPTGIPGLDTILHGGLYRGGVYLIAGAPGTGKTILGNQIAFSHARAGGRAVVVTLLAEMHARLVAHLRDLSFFDPALVSDTVYYVSGYPALEEGGLAGLRTLVRQIVRDQRATLFVLDGLESIEQMAETDLAFKQFVLQLQALMEASGCTALMLDHPTAVAPRHVYAMADGVLLLEDVKQGLRVSRTLTVQKFRGSRYLRGGHHFMISNEGVTVYPRTELLLATPSQAAPAPSGRKPFGIARLDEMLHGGPLAYTTTMLLGVPGSGKTLLGLHFLVEGARQGETGLYFGFYEGPTQLMHKARQVNLDLGSFIDQGLLRLLWQPPIENVIDALADRLLREVRAMGVKRLFIDSFSGFVEATTDPDRLHRFFVALANELHAQGVTVLFSVELPNRFGADLQTPYDVSAVTDAIILLRYVELRSQLYRLVSIVKTSASQYDSSIREFQITEQGIDVADTFASAEAILTGVARHLTPFPASGDSPFSGVSP